MPPTRINGQNSFTIAICGGGFSGLCIAIGLLHRNVPFHIYESAPAFAEIGAGVAFGPNALRAMKLIDPRIREGYDKIATQNGSETRRETWFNFVVGMDCGLGKPGDHVVEIKDRDGVGQSSAHRAAFLDILVDLVPKDKVTFSKRLVAVHEANSGVTLTFADGTSTTASAVIGSDGVRSNIRKIILGEHDPAAHPRFAGKYAYRSLLPMSDAVSALGESQARNSMMWLGLHGRLVHYPIDHGDRINVAFIHSKSDGKWDDDERWVLSSSKENLSNDFEGFGQEVQNVLGLIEKPEMWAFFEHPDARTFYRGRMCMVGDAAHASAPYQGAGAGMALEDAYVMSCVLGAAFTTALDQGADPDVEKAFKAFDAVRRPRTQKMARTSRECGVVLDCEDERVGEDRERLAENLRMRFGWIWEYDLERDGEVAMEMVKEGRGRERGREVEMRAFL
ncbi:hypothetical protein ACLMJK_007970 [Lecanora helva]